jgi:hypothetical protein
MNRWDSPIRNVPANLVMFISRSDSGFRGR